MASANVEINPRVGLQGQQATNVPLVHQTSAPMHGASPGQQTYQPAYRPPLEGQHGAAGKKGRTEKRAQRSAGSDEDYEPEEEDDDDEEDEYDPDEGDLEELELVPKVYRGRGRKNKGASPAIDTALQRQMTSPSMIPKPSGASKPPQIEAEAEICRCQKTRCLKKCSNMSENDQARKRAIKACKQKNAFAFGDRLTRKTSRSDGCKCKSSACLKKYCDCFRVGLQCGIKCRCTSCGNGKPTQVAMALPSERAKGSQPMIAAAAEKGKPRQQPAPASAFAPSKIPGAAPLRNGPAAPPAAALAHTPPDAAPVMPRLLHPTPPAAPLRSPLHPPRDRWVDRRWADQGDRWRAQKPPSPEALSSPMGGAGLGSAFQWLYNAAAKDEGTLSLSPSSPQPLSAPPTPVQQQQHTYYSRTFPSKPGENCLLVPGRSPAVNKMSAGDTPVRHETAPAFSELVRTLPVGPVAGTPEGLLRRRRMLGAGPKRCVKRKLEVGGADISSTASGLLQWQSLSSNSQKLVAPPLPTRRLNLPAVPTAERVKEPMAVFGKASGGQAIPKAAVLQVMDYLTCDDLYNSCLVSKRWEKLAFDDSLWYW